jgi:hypothetical protein
MAITQKDLPKFFTTQKTGVGTRVNADGAGTLGSNTNAATIYTGATTYGSIITSLIFNTDDTTAGNAYVFIYNGSSVRPLGIVNIPIQSGDLGTVAAVDALSGSGITLQGLPIDSQGNKYIHLEAGEVLKFSMKAAPTAAKTFYATVLALDGTA